MVFLAMGHGAGRAANAVRLVPWLLLAARLASAKVFINQEDALKKAFPLPMEVQRKTLFLSGEETQRIETVARAKMDSRVLTYYEAMQNGKVVGTAFFDTQVVRSMPMTFMALILPDGTLDYVEILSFYEPEDYLPRPTWLNLFRKKRLDNNLRLRWGIPNVAGSSLTCQTITDGVRRLLATYQVAVQKGGLR